VARHDAPGRGELPELGGVGDRSRAATDGQRRQPLGVEAGRLGRDPRLILRLEVGLDDVAGDLEVLVDRLAGDEQLHDLARALEDAVDAHVAEELLGRDRLLAAVAQRLGGLVAAAAADLDQVVEDLPAHLRPVQLRDRGFLRRRAGLVLAAAAAFHFQQRWFRIIAYKCFQP
jgi:hypothetical protein